MSDLIDDLEEGAGPSNAPEFTVSEISGAVKKTLEGSFGRIRVRGEVGRVFRARSGHLYYDIKDDRNVLACTTWKGQLAHLSVQPEEGLEVIVTGRLTTFGAQSKYNLNVDDVAVAGAGALMAMLEKRKAQLQAEGLFEASRKKQIPYLPEVIGVVTSPSGAVIRDILHRLRDRFPRKVLVWPVAVQGANCAPEVANAIKGFNTLTPGGALPRPDLLIVARGGGSIEDLWGFNEEIVARAAAASEIPLISAVGHETDTTLIDFVSDQRAPTPTAAAELAVPVRLELMAWVEEQEARLSRVLSLSLGRRGERLRDLSRALPRPETLVDSARQRLDLWEERLPSALRATAQRKRLRLSDVTGSLRPGLLRRALREDAGRLVQQDTRLGPGLIRAVREKKSDLDRRAAGLRLSVLRTKLDRSAETFERLTQRLSDAAARAQTDRVAKLENLNRLRETVGYKATLARGYAVVRGVEGVLTSKAAAQDQGVTEIEFQDGRLKLGGTKPKRGKGDAPEQGSLF
jgi:exodeoxyribonuclease VII large subunit